MIPAFYLDIFCESSFPPANEPFPAQWVARPVLAYLKVAGGRF